MIISTIRTEDDSTVYTHADFPTDNIKEINFVVCKNNKESLGYISFSYMTKDTDFHYQTRCIQLGQKETFVIVDGKSFVINSIDDAKNLYKYLTGTDLILMEKQLKTLSKKHNINKDFK